MINNILNKGISSISNAVYVKRTPVREFINDTLTDKIIGSKYECVIPEMNYARISVKVLGDAQLDEPKSAQKVEFEGLAATAYVNSQNRPAVAFKAEKIYLSKN